ncbi:hypothetical protein LCGC14_1064890 [marine sediment metagenome]|uniref:Uncharacterized protein n=1 Tax=marine sediment metagenome TaxID=412755 RepID=A0A0F9QQW4_9ZZZZ|nr:hypothetical protein [Pricia sp.]
MSSVFLSKVSPDAIMSPDTDREIERIDREAALIEQRPRQELEEDRSPTEDIEMDIMLEGILAVLQRRI